MKTEKFNQDSKCSLREDVIKYIGFYDSGEKDHTGNIKWRLKFPYYHYELQLVIMPYPHDNPNCGILSIYCAESVEESYDSVTRKNGFSKITKRKIKFPMVEIPIAHYVNSPERLRILILALTHQNI